VLPLYDASAGTADKATVNEVFKAVNTFTAETAVDTADVLSLYDASAGTADKATVNELFKAVNTFSSEASVATDDVLPLYDASTGTADKTTIANLRSPLGLLSSSTDNTVPRFDSTGGNLQTSGFTVDDNNHISSFGGNIQFPASQAASADANNLDDYEEGTGSSTVTSGTGSFTTVSGTYIYTKVGRLVCVSVTITITTNGTAATFTTCTIPFTNTASLAYPAHGKNATTGMALAGTVGAGVATISAITRYDNVYSGADSNTLRVSAFHSI
jgi:hypothetical protein